MKNAGWSARVAAGVILILSVFAVGLSGNNRNQASSPLGTRFSGGVVPVRVHMNQYRTCFAVAPADWAIYGHRREGDAVDIAGPNMAASWAVIGIPGFMVRSNPYQLGTPELRISTALSNQFRGAPVTYGEPTRDDFGYIWLPYESSGVKGVVVYQVWAMPGDPLGFILVQRQAQTASSLWAKQGAQAIFVALSIRCTRQLQPSPDSGPGPGVEGRMESTYNEQLGMEYAHDAQTGDNYWVSSAADWNDDGPEGPGYYKRVGNDLRKLAPGRSQ